MNKVFTNRTKIVLDKYYWLTSDGDSGIVLTFSETRQRKNKETGETEDYVFEEKLYYTRIVQALKKYVDLTQNNCKTLEEILEKTSRIDALLERLDVEFKQF